MPTVSRGVSRWLLHKGATLEDFADRLSHIWTFGLLIVLACIISWKQGVNKPIVCLCPAHSHRSFEEYAENTCWNSHFITRSDQLAQYPIRSPFPHVSISKANISSTVTLYQWLPVLLCFQALLFKLPNIFMYILHSLSGVSFDKISGLTSGYQNLNMNERELLGKQSGRYVYNWCKQFENCLPWRFLTMLWLGVKILYCANIIAQLCLIDGILKTTDPPKDNSTSYGDVISDNIFENNATLWKESPMFPRRVICSLEIIQIQNIQRYELQCNLSLNEFNERAYMFLWVWLLVVSIVSCLSFVVWISSTVIPILRKRYVTNGLSLSEDINVKAIPTHDLNTFADLIGEDGVMILKLISANSSENVVRDIICSMWRRWEGERPRHGHIIQGVHAPEARAPFQHTVAVTDNVPIMQFEVET